MVHAAALTIHTSDPLNAEPPLGPLGRSFISPQGCSTFARKGPYRRSYAAAPGDFAIARVDVSADGGRHWQQAQLESPPDHPWSWTLWQTTVDLPRGDHKIAVRAWDDCGEPQPALAEDVWNFNGYLNSSWRRIPVRAISLFR
jgi:sulfite oxidase